ncbi:Altered inheritance of mitochondria protein 32 [Mycena indigotica]|uniref:Altered inheritance of mitochondria protein 32 n=1 Tax=Mycena indigotica TaxID=2126181 RepID=A0A8H6SRR8_9AGAR|nr:Altered inheritance of mitochondria protein 32 [Mycena indigotica]KAF7303840.1 Altered inheritance of mitochondria protein 32 [Mycena indigotica]
MTLSRLLSTTKADPILHGTVAYHRSYILLPVPESPQILPARVSNPLHRSLQLQTMPWGGLVNFASTMETGNVTAFSTLNGVLHLPTLTSENVSDIAEQLQRHATVPGKYPQDGKLHIYVCTHAARDCRCGDTGGVVFRALCEELDARKRVDPGGTANRVVLGEVAHVGGHQFAANVLVFPHGEWFGRLTPNDVSALLDSLLSSDQRPLNLQDKPLLPQFWRGRMGLHKEQQMSLVNSQTLK